MRLASVFHPWVALPLFVLFSTAPAKSFAGQNGPPPLPVRDTQAIAAIQTALGAMGGAGAIGVIQNAVVQGTSVATPDNGNGITNFTWTSAGNDFRYENDANAGSHVLVSNGGNPADQENDNWVTIPSSIARANLPFHIPALVLFNELSNQNYTLTFVGQTTLNGVAAVQVNTSDNSDFIGQLVTPQQWYFDPKSGLPLRVVYRIPSFLDAQSYSTGTIDFASYRAVSGVLVPFQLTISEGPGSLVATVTTATFNAPLGPNQFTTQLGINQ
jgi:hypothetical protein